MTEPKIGWIQCWQNDLRIFWNPTKNRQEKYFRCQHGDREWFLRDALPARVWEESFIGRPHFRVATFGVGLDREWDTNGDGAPAAGNFASANELGGGLILRTDGGLNDWLALHTGDQYPTAVSVSPHFNLRTELVDITDVFFLLGLVSVTNLETGNNQPWATPDDGMWLEYDTAVDGNLRFVTRSGAVETSTSIGAPTVGHVRVNIVVNDAHDEAGLLMKGTIQATHDTHLPGDDVKLKPIFMVGTRETETKDLHLHDFRLIFDRGPIV
ncbi:MAG: hypothetical protein NWE89_07205 [Candidatus Bathyarchaeota archaeon]|nr:hypothetical protein [Candidatus Bathyarchaeota archaeon]